MIVIAMVLATAIPIATSNQRARRAGAGAMGRGAGCGPVGTVLAAWIARAARSSPADAGRYAGSIARERARIAWTPAVTGSAATTCPASWRLTWRPTTHSTSNMVAAHRSVRASWAAPTDCSGAM